MLKKRLVGCVLVRDGIVVQSLGFSRYLPVGRVDITLEFLNQWGIDEIVLLDMTAGARGSGPDAGLVRASTGKCFVPLTVGGGIRTVEHMDALMHAGADKIALNAAAIDTPGLITAGAARYGNQCIVVSIDARRTAPGTYEVFTDGGRRATGLSPAALARQAVDRGAGEILLTSIDRDGAKTGYDLELVDELAGAVNVPVIVCGGAGHPRHFHEALTRAHVSAAAAGNYFHFTEHSPIVTKAWLRGVPFDIRLDTYAHYRDIGFDHDGRIARRDDAYLDDLIFEVIPPEII
jgi:cyclase